MASDVAADTLIQLVRYFFMRLPLRNKGEKGKIQNCTKLTNIILFKIYFMQSTKLVTMHPCLSLSLSFVLCMPSWWYFVVLRL